MIELLGLAVFAGLLLYAAYSDVATMTIPNWVSIALALAFPAAALAVRTPLPEVGLHLFFGLITLVVCFVLFNFRVLGGGDAKLIAAASVWTGAAAIGQFLVWTAIAGGVIALVLLLARSRMQPGETKLAFVNRLLTPRGGVPYGVAICIGGLAALNALPFAAPLVRGALTTP